MKTAATAPLFRECQDILMDAVSTGSLFHKTGGEYLSSDGCFISQERKKRCIKYNALKDKKQEHEDKRIQHEDAQSVIQDLQEKKNKTHTMILMRKCSLYQN